MAKSITPVFGPRRKRAKKPPKRAKKSITWMLDRVETGAKSKDPTNPQAADLDVGSLPTPRSGEPQDVANQNGRKRHNLDS